MKTLTLLRHAKSSWADPGMKDFDRQLNERGREAARLVGRELTRLGIHFDHILGSPAARVRETLDELAKGSGMRLEIDFDRRIYLADPESLVDLVRTLPDDSGSALLVGHNPGLHELALQLSTRDNEGLRDRILAKYPTGALAEIQLPAERWSEAGSEPGTITALILPRELAG